LKVIEIIQRGTTFLEQKGIESPRLQVELLLSHVLKMPRLQLYLNFEREISEANVSALREMIRRRGLHEPLQHLVGSTSFCGYEIVVNPSVLIPRPETEILAEKAWEYLNRHSAQQPEPLKMLDFGTGSGCLPIAIALHCPDIQLWAVDISEEALKTARENAGRHFLAQRISFLQADSLDVLPPELRFNLIISNPPYIPSAEIANLSPEVKDHDPHLALDGGPDGLKYYRYLEHSSRQRLVKDAAIMMEFGDDQGPSICQLFENPHWYKVEMVKDYSHRNRILIALRAET
jgi:release factor glutamine methyltransferase